jgi:hypothetical protein
VADEQIQGQGQGSGTEQGQQGQGSGAETGQQGAGGDQQGAQVHGNTRTFDGPFDPDRARALIDNLRTVEKTLKQENADARKRLKEIEDAQLTEQQKLARDRDELAGKIPVYEARVRELAVNNEVLAEASGLGIISPKHAAKLLDQKAIQFDADGNPTNVKELLSQLVIDAPWLKAPAVVAGEQGQGQAARPAPNVPPANPPRTENPRPTFSKSQLNDFAFYTANKDAILQAMKEGRITD